ncbi:MAG: arginine--tRNA ligase, partial [Alphaproteobacteria bacterium]|nr:arginine--tRNA ligase [Alphaproteobacteria bacterium]
MNIFNWLKEEVKAILAEMAARDGWPAGLPFDRITAEPPRDPSHGDIATNAAMILTKLVGRKPREIAEPLAAALRALPEVTSVEVAGPGFINIRLAAEVWQRQVSAMLDAGIGFGSSTMGAGKAVNVEYVSANPTGPLHAAHARGAVFGDALAALLEKAGYAVAREYYTNDAGAQVETLARSTYLRYREALGETVEIPAGHYPGEYLKDVGRAIAERDGAKWLGAPEEAWLEPFRAFAVDLMMVDVEKDLIALGITMDRFSSERALVADGAVDRALAKLEADGLVYTGVLEPPKGK